ncbi:MAG TPA: transglycosylase SLT domain-containing protein [Candidatus Binataceae bacterium]|nr:transglycosylase SLT domain-containing protein [Candidatus Binataceae bacterium]
MEARVAHSRFCGQAGLTGLAATALLSALCAAFVVNDARAETTISRHSNLEFPRPASIEPNIKFWVDTFTSYTARDFVLHDKDDIWKVYQVLRVPGDGDPTPEDVQWANTYLKTKYADILNRLAEGHQPGTFEEQRVVNLFKADRNPNYAMAAQNLRVQQGMSERFRETLVRARLYLPHIQNVFQTYGLPAELALLPTVESGFHPYARSKAGATGLWQFTRSTGAQYMTVNGWHDDRLNPSRETEAAAQLLLHNHELLGSWPLAITAYNYGTGGMMQAVEETGGGDYSEVLRRFAGPHFGFASKNYYSEFLAAVQVYQYRDAYFPGVDQEEPVYEEPPPPVVHPVRYASRRHGRYLRRVSYSGRGGRHRTRRAVYHSRSRRRMRSA